MKSSHFLALLIGGIALKIFSEPITYCPAGSVEQRAKYDLEQSHSCLQQYFDRHGEAPRSWAELKASSPGFDLERFWIDPWGNPYFVQVGWSGTHIRVGTRGRDGELGGKGEDSDRSFDFVLGGSGFAYTETDA